MLTGASTEVPAEIRFCVADLEVLLLMRADPSVDVAQY